MRGIPEGHARPGRMSVEVLVAWLQSGQLDAGSNGVEQQDTRLGRDHPVPLKCLSRQDGGQVTLATSRYYRTSSARDDQGVSRCINRRALFRWSPAYQARGRVIRATTTSTGQV